VGELHDGFQSGHTSLEQNVQQNEELEELRGALRQLNDEHQTILILRFVERKSHEEVALVLGKSIEAVATAQHRALKRLAELLGAEKSDRHYLRGK
jgi:RNA polymerase sigma-70 factor (ECF subfamily)